MSKVISGIQQTGIGIPDVHEAWSWYRKHFGMNIPIFEESATANLMVSYTGGVAQSRHAVLAINLQGGGGFEIWQFTNRQPQPPNFKVQLGDYGIFASKIKSRDVLATYEYFKKQKLNISAALYLAPCGQYQFFVQDPYGNFFQVVQCENWFKEGKNLTGGSGGFMMGVSDISQSRKLYSDILGYEEVVYDQTSQFKDYAGLTGGDCTLRRV